MPGIQTQTAPITGLQGAGLGLATGLHNLAAQYVQNQKSNQQQQKLQQALLANDYTPEEARLISLLPENQRLQALQLRLPGMDQTNQANLAQKFAQAQQEQEQQETEPVKVKQAPQQPKEKMKSKDVLQALKDSNIPITPDLKKWVDQQTNAFNTNPQYRQQFQPQQLQPQAQSQNQIGAAQGLPPQVPTQFPQQVVGRQPFLQKPLSPADKIAQEKLNLGLRKEQREIASEETRAKEHGFKENADYIKQVDQRVKSAKTKLRDLERLDELENEKLETAGYTEFLKRSGFDIPALMNPQSQEYDKIATGFIREAGNTFKGKVSNYEADLFLKLIPTLSMTPEGRKRVRAGMKYLERAEIDYGKVKDAIIKENGGKPPLDLAAQVNQRIDPYLDKLSERFKEDLKKPVPEAQNRLVTAVQAGLGETLNSGILQRATKGGLLGAGIGTYVYPGLGTTAGALGGAALGALGGFSLKDLL